MTIKDVAARSGYSVGTVSRVLNNQSHVSEAARTAILRAVKESGFQLNANARQLKQQSSNSILAICKGRSNPFFDSLLAELQSRIAEIGYPLVVDYVDDTENVVQRALRLCPVKKPLGLLFLGGNREEFLADFHKITLPCVLVTSMAEDLPFENLSSVSTNDKMAAQQAVSHLISLGHRNIVLLGGTRNQSDVTEHRYQGCMEAFAENGIAFQADRDYETGRYTFDDAYRATQSLLKKNPSFTALFAMSDVMAIGAIRALQDVGKRVPEDVSVIGFDGLSIGEYTIPRLSTMSQSVNSLAEQSLQLLHRSIQERCGASHKIVPVTLQHRESVRSIG